MIRRGARLSAQSEMWGDRVSFYLVDFDRAGEKRVPSITWEPIADGVSFEPAFTLHTESAQELFEQMWAQGFRSKHDRGGADRLDAARAEHIADLRKAAKLA